MRSNSLFLISNPAFRQAFLTWPSTSYSCSGMVKLSRTSLALRTFSRTISLAPGAPAAGLAPVALRAGFGAAGLVADLAAGFDAGFFAGFTAAFARAAAGAGLAAAAFFGAGLAEALAAVVVFVAAGLRISGS